MRIYRHGARARWYIDVRDPQGRRRKLPAYTDKGATEEYGRKVERLAALRSAHADIPAELHAWLAQLEQSKREALVRVGIVDSRALDGLRTLADLTAEFGESIRARGRSAAHAKATPELAFRVLTGFGARYWHEIDASAAEAWILRRRDEGWSTATANRHVAAVRQFSRWMVTRGRASVDPLLALKRAPERPERDRRALTPDEARRLIAAAPASRALVYRVALETGLRLGELRALRSGWVSGDTLTVPARSAKSGRAATLPLRPSTARQLASLPPSGLGIAAHWRAAEAVRRDAKAAGLALDGLDFHALRHAFVTWLSGVAQPHVAQGLARHSTPVLTLGTYTHVRPLDEVAAIRALPELGGSASGATPEPSATAPDTEADSSGQPVAAAPESGSTSGATSGAAAVRQKRSVRDRKRLRDTVRAWGGGGIGRRIGLKSLGAPTPNWRSLQGLTTRREGSGSTPGAAALAEIVRSWPALTASQRARISAIVEEQQR